MRVFKLLLLLLALSVVIGCKKDTATSGTVPTMNVSQYEQMKDSNKGKVLIVNVFASWCPPCEEETPDFVAVYNEMHGADFEIVGLSIDTSMADLEGFIKKHKISYPVYQIGSTLQRKLFADKVPTTIIYRKDGSYYNTAMGMLSATQLKNLAKGLK